MKIKPQVFWVLVGIQKMKDLFPSSKVLMKDVVTPVPQEEVKAVIRKCLEQAALVNYQRLSEYAKLEGELLLTSLKLFLDLVCFFFSFKDIS